MERFLIEKLDALINESKHLIENINLGILSDGVTSDSYIIEEAALTRGESEIIVLPHGRHTATPLHRHDYVEIMIVLSGELHHKIDGRVIVLGEGDVLFMNRHVSHSIDRPCSGDVALNIIMSNRFLSAMATELESTAFEPFITENSRDDGDGIFMHFRTKGQKQLENLVENILYELTEYTADTSILVGTASLLFRYLSLKHDELLVDSTARGDKRILRLQAIMSYVKSDYPTASLPDLAARLGLTVPYLSKLISVNFGKSFKEIVVDERMARAVEMLSKTDLPIGSIIRNVGYENSSYFHREFRRRMGKTPLDVRKRR